jgi:hypothetical protein
MTDAPRKRPWLQFHLSTLVVVMFVAAGLLSLNMQWQPEDVVWLDQGGGSYGIYAESQGWPLTFHVRTGHGYPFVVPSWLLKGLFWDVLLAIGVLVAAGQISEWLIRRKERP